MNRFDIVHAHYLFCSWNHSGQASKLYERLAKISRYYTPARRFESAFENSEQVAIYEALLHKSGKAYGYSACLCCGLDVMGIGLCSYCDESECSVTGDEPCNCSDEDAEEGDAEEGDAEEEQ